MQEIPELLVPRASVTFFHHRRSQLKAYNLKRRRPFIGFVAPIWFGISFATTGRQTE
jgi:hypothetical protein